MTTRFRRGEGGFTLIFSIVLLLVLSLTIPALVNWVRQETKDTVKVKRSTVAFHMAEAGADQGFWKLQESQATWTAAKNGTAVTDYNGGTQFSLTLASGGVGKYTVAFSSGPGTDQVTILAKGRDDSTLEVRAIQVVVESNGAGQNAISAKTTAGFGAATSVEWGPIIAKVSMDSGGKDHPRLYSAGDITGMDTNGSADPNTDSIQWWSYKQDLPADPSIDFSFYQTSATTLGSTPGSAPNGCGNGNNSSYYYSGNASFKGCTSVTGKVFYITGNCDFASGSGGNQVIADIICLGDLSVSGNGGGNLTETLTVPPTAWKEYGNDWTYYKTNFDPGNPYANFADVPAGTTRAGLTKSVSNIVVHGFLYTGGSQGLTGGGNGVLVGTLYSANSASLSTSNCTLYYDPTTASNVRVSNVTLTRESWKEVTGQSFP